MATLDISFLIILIGALFLYFGRIIGETKVEKIDQLGYYEEGLFFSAVFIYIPSLIAYYIYVTTSFIVSPILLIFIQIVVLICLLWNLISNAYLIKYELIDEPELIKKAEEKNEQIKLQDTFIGKMANMFQF